MAAKASQTRKWKVTCKEISCSCKSTPYNMIFGGEKRFVLPAGGTHAAGFSFNHEISSS